MTLILNEIVPLHGEQESGLRGMTPHEADAIGVLEAAQEALCRTPNWTLYAV
jgi:hypothetical protein